LNQICFPALFAVTKGSVVKVVIVILYPFISCFRLLLLGDLLPQPSSRPTTVATPSFTSLARVLDFHILVECAVGEPERVAVVDAVLATGPTFVSAARVVFWVITVVHTDAASDLGFAGGLSLIECAARHGFTDGFVVFPIANLLSRLSVVLGLWLTLRRVLVTHGAVKNLGILGCIEFHARLQKQLGGFHVISQVNSVIVSSPFDHV
jgi:hypothetical protein